MRHIIFLLAIVLLSTSAFAQSHQWKTALVVDCPDADVKASMTKTLEGELGKMKNVLLTKTDEDVRVLINMTLVADRGPDKIYAGSTVVVFRMREDNDEWWALVAHNASGIWSYKIPEFAKFFTGHLRGTLDKLTKANFPGEK